MRQKLMQWYGGHKVLSWVVAGVLVLYILVGYVAVPLTVHHILNHQVSQSLGRRVAAASVKVNPFTFAVSLRNFSISDGEKGPFVNADEIYVNIDPFISLVKWGLAINSFRITGPEIYLVRTENNQFNFSDLTQPPQKTAPPEGAKPSKTIRLLLNRFELLDGRLHYADHVPSEPFKTTLSDLDVRTVSPLDTDPEAQAVLFEVSGRTEAYEAFDINGKADFDPLLIETVVQANAFNLAKYAPYYNSYFNAKVIDGKAGLHAKFDWSKKTQAIREILLTLTGLNLVSTQNTPLVAIPRFEVEGAEIDLNARLVRLGRMRSRDGDIHVRLDADGHINLQRAFADIDRQSDPPDQPIPPSTPTASASWVVEAPETEIQGFTVHFIDQQPLPEANLNVSQVSLIAKNLSTRKDTWGEADLSLKWADQGSIRVNGAVGLIPFQADLNAEAKALDIRPLQPYINDFMQLVVTKGSFDTNGALKMVPQAAGMDIRYSGQAALNNFQSVAPDMAGGFLNWKSLNINGLDIGTTPFRLGVNEASLTDFYNRLTIDADGTSNLAMIMKDRKLKETDPASSHQPQGHQKRSKQGAPPAKVKESEDQLKGADIKIKTVILQGGKIDFTDRFVKPNVRFHMTRIAGRLSGLDAIKTHQADLFLKGMVRGNVPMEMKGQINPLIQQPFADITIGLNAVDLSPFTPYAGKYMGYQLKKGQLSLNLSYRLAENKLKAENKVLLSQLTLGEAVESPHATQLPIKLALALLKDRHGNIDIDLPVTGDLDDPKFSIGGIVLKMVVNLIVEIVSSPFKLLGALFGGGEELAYLDFNAGRSAITPERIGNLDKLAKIMYERPGLNLEIQGQVDPESDTDGMRQLRFEDQLKAAKLKTMMARGQKAMPLEQIELTAEDRTQLVRKAYTAAAFPKPRGDKGNLKKLSQTEMEKLLYTAIEITQSDLRLLAHQRALAVQEYLINQGKVEIHRLFIIEPKLGGAQTEELPQSRVKFAFT